MQTITFTLTIDAQAMRVEYTPNYFTSFPVGHFQFFSPHEPRRRIPVSETGYKSHFAPMPEIEAAPSPQDYARALALALIRAGSAPQPDDEADDGDHLTLF
jgi:hypothetical protein